MKIDIWRVELQKILPSIYRKDLMTVIYRIIILPFE